MMNEIFRARDVVTANEDRVILNGMNIKLMQGEILGVFGTFDSGKTTLLDLITGSVLPISGNVFLYGKKVPEERDGGIKWPVLARIGGNSTLINGFSLWENIMVMRGSGIKYRYVNPSLMKKTVASLFKEYDIDLDPGMKAGQLSRFQCFLLEILKARFGKAEIILIDDFALECTYGEYLVLGDLMNRLKGEGVTFLITSCRIGLLKRYSDRISFLYGGRIIKSVCNKPQYDADIDCLLSTMFSKNPNHPEGNTTGAVVLSLRNLDVGLADEISFDLRQGEITSIIDPSKTVLTALSDKLINGKQTENGAIFYKGRRFISLNVQNAKNGIVLIDHGALNRINEGMTVIDNLCMGFHRRFSRFGVIKHSVVKYVKKEFDTWYGSGKLTERTDCHNLPKRDRVALILFRLKLMNPSVVICRNPTSDTDMITYGMLEDCLAELAMNGAAVCLLNSNVEKIDDFADRYLIMAKGRLFYDVPYNKISDMLLWG